LNISPLSGHHSCRPGAKSRLTSDTRRRLHRSWIGFREAQAAIEPRGVVESTAAALTARSPKLHSSTGDIRNWSNLMSNFRDWAVTLHLTLECRSRTRAPSIDGLKQSRRKAGASNRVSGPKHLARGEGICRSLILSMAPNSHVGRNYGVVFCQ